MGGGFEAVQRQTPPADGEYARTAGTFYIRFPVGTDVLGGPSVEITVIVNRSFPQGEIPLGPPGFR